MLSKMTEQARVESRKYKEHDPRTEARADITTMGGLTERAKMENAMSQPTQGAVADEDDAELRRLRQDMRAVRMAEMQAEQQATNANSYRAITEEEFAKGLMEQHQAGEGITICHFPENGSRYSQWLDEHLARRAHSEKFASTKFIVVPETAADRMPFVSNTPTVVCFDGNSIGGVLERPKVMSIDVDDFCLDVDRWLAMMHGHEWD